MAVGSARRIAITFTGDLDSNDTYAAATNATSPGQVQIIALTTGANTITAPAAGTTPTGCTIIPPAGNTNLLTLKGVTGDTGVLLHKTDPTSIGVDTTLATFCLTAAAPTNVRFVWT